MSQLFDLDILCTPIHKHSLFAYHVLANNKCAFQPPSIFASCKYQDATLYLGFEKVVFEFHTVKDEEASKCKYNSIETSNGCICHVCEISVYEWDLRECLQCNKSNVRAT